jgi:Gas vesicle protein
MSAGISDAAASRQVTLVELVDRLLGKGVVISGDITLAVADIDLVQVELRALVASVDSLKPALEATATGAAP